MFDRGKILVYCILGVHLYLSPVLSDETPMEVTKEPSLQERQIRAQAILKEVPLIDGHNDLPWNIRKFVHNQLSRVDFTQDLTKVKPWAHSHWSHTDLPRLQKGMVGGQFWVAYVPCKSQFLNAVQLTLEQIDVIKRFISSYPNVLQLADSSTSIQEAHKNGKIASLIGVEGGHSISNSLATLRMMYDLGVRYMTLTHTCSTPWATTSSESNPNGTPGKVDKGLSKFGEKVVLEMNRLGMMVDLSHVSFATQRRTLEISRAPVVFTHSGAYALCNITRNVPDDVLKSLAKNGGIMMIPFFSNFLTCRSSAYIYDVIRHLNYIKDFIGVDHIGLGGDFDGINLTPVGLDDVSKYPNIFIELLKYPSWSELDLKKLAGLNLLRVMEQVEKVRDQMKAQGFKADESSIEDEELHGYPTNCTYTF